MLYIVILQSNLHKHVLIYTCTYYTYRFSISYQTLTVFRPKDVFLRDITLNAKLMNYQLNRILERMFILVIVNVEYCLRP